MVNTEMLKRMWDDRTRTYQGSLRHLADDLNAGVISIKEFEDNKMRLRQEIFGGMKNPYEIIKKED